MMKHYKVQAKLMKNEWVTIHKSVTHKDAIAYMTDNQSENNKYPLRIVRVVETVVFEGKQGK